MNVLNVFRLTFECQISSQTVMDAQNAMRACNGRSFECTLNKDMVAPPI